MGCLLLAWSLHMRPGGNPQQCGALADSFDAALVLGNRTFHTQPRGICNSSWPAVHAYRGMPAGTN